MPQAGAYVVVDGQTYRVLGRMHDDVVTAVRQATADGSSLELDVVPEPTRGGDHPGQGTLFLHGARLTAVAVLSGPVSPTGHPIGF